MQSKNKMSSTGENTKVRTLEFGILHKHHGDDRRKKSSVGRRTKGKIEPSPMSIHM